jgi:prepilin-type N-terminal cleavage/methylation domain-containing protein
MMFKRLKSEKGFSLIELMVVVAIIGILAALAVPRFQAFQARSKAAEATTSLGLAYTLQIAYHGDNDTYGSLGAIGFQLNGNTIASTSNTFASSTAAKIRYQYVSSGLTNAVFLVTATANTGSLGGCQTANHVVIVNQNKAIGPSTTTASTNSAATPIPGC